MSAVDRTPNAAVPGEDGSLDGTLTEQRAYYAARAAEYDEWFQRRGRYDHGREANARWHAEVAMVRAALAAAHIEGEVLELACGTGLWTEQLVRGGAHVTAIDASPEMLTLNRARLEQAGLADRVVYAQADLFAWRPDRTYDAVFFGFWLSHVPDERLGPFLAAVAAALGPGGRLFFVDSRREPTASSPDQPLSEAADPIMRRRLNDGREFRIVKVFREPAALVAAFARHGIDLTAEETPTYFQYGVGARRRG